MSETWIIKDTAPVDAGSYELSEVSINFTSNNESFVAIDVYTEDNNVSMTYYTSDGSTLVPAGMDSSSDTHFTWDDSAYKTIIFDTAPTGDLLAWLQKNADKQQINTEYLTNTAELTAVADAIRAKGGTSAQLVYPSGFVSAIKAIETGGGTTPIDPSDITFYDYDGTVVAAWSADELSDKTELPEVPSHDGLICQGWNWTLEALKSSGRKRIPVGALFTTDDNKTRIYIELQEGRTSPILGCCPNGTVTIDWGDGTATETLTGTGVMKLKQTSVHNYSNPGRYIITLSMSDGGELGFYGSSTENIFGGILRQANDADVRNVSYLSAVKKIECANHVTSIGSSAFCGCYGLETISVPAALKYVLGNAFCNARSLKAFIAGNITDVDPRTSISGGRSFIKCNTLAAASFRLTNKNGVASYNYDECLLLADVFIRDGATRIGNYAFYENYAMTYLELPSTVATILDYAFGNCYGMRIYDFSHCTSVPSVASTSFANIPSDCEIRVPSSLVDEWKAATNWATYADHIVGV